VPAQIDKWLKSYSQSWVKSESAKRNQDGPKTLIARCVEKLAIPQRLKPHRDSAIRRRSRAPLPRFGRLLPEAGCDSGSAIGAREVSQPFLEGRGSWQMLHTTHLSSPQ